MRSHAKHDAWQKLLRCPLLTLRGDASMEENLAAIGAQLALERA